MNSEVVTRLTKEKTQQAIKIYVIIMLELTKNIKLYQVSDFIKWL